MTTPAQFIQGLHTFQAGLAVYGAYQSYVAITMLQGYEATAKKAAEWSNEAERQLESTRSTQAAGALAIATSFVAAVVLATIPQQLPHLARFVASPVLLVGTVLVRKYISSYWGQQGGTRVPLPQMGDYNKAQRKTKQLLEVLEWLEYSWVATSFGWGVVGV